MKCLISTKEEKTVRTALGEKPIRPLNSGEVLIHNEYSSINYKDALGVTGKGSIFKTFPIVGGIDAAGTVEESKDPSIQKGDFVLVTGCGLGETHDGGYSEAVIEPAENIVIRPTHLSAREAMIYGTAGFTAALALERMMLNGQKPEMGPILVTGATGGVGQFAISFFHKMGFEVHALTGKRQMSARLTEIGAKKIVFTSQLDLGERPLESVRYGGVVDNLGGNTLSKLVAHVNLWGNVCSIGLAEGHELKTSVMPLILRGVSVIGISSNNTPRDLRLKIWDRLSSDLKPENLSSFLSETIHLQDVLAASQRMLDRQTHGRIVVEI
jgi:acrylyl-CoA reductase (NADPH)